MSKKVVLTLKQRIYRFLENNIFFVILSITIVFISSLVSLVRDGNDIYKYVKLNYFQNQYWYDQIENLYPNVNISYFISYMGQPTLIKSFNDLEEKEYVFINKKFYLQVITNTDDTVKTFAVTSREKDFQPTFIRPGQETLEEPETITLNKTTFSQITPELTTYMETGEPLCIYDQGMNRFRYFEGSYEASIGNYQTTYYGINDAGYVSSTEIFPELGELFNKGIYTSDQLCYQVSPTFRMNAPVNTYVSTSSWNIPMTASDTAKIRLGVDFEDVRVIAK